MKNQNYIFAKVQQQEVTFEVPDDFPIKNIPEFKNEDHFNTWFKENKFSKLSVKDIEERDDQDNHLDEFLKIKIYEDDEVLTKDFPKNVINHIKTFLNEISSNNHLIKGEDFIGFLFNYYPREFLEVLSSILLPIDVYVKIKKNLKKKYPETSFKSHFKKLITKSLLDSASETFLTFLENEKISCKHINFLDLDYSQPSNFDGFSGVIVQNLPFTLKKLIMLSKSTSFNEEQEDQLKSYQRFVKLIETKQDEKIEYLTNSKLLSKAVTKKILHEQANLNPKYRSFLLNNLKEQ
jgi:hypothetical protein